MIQKIFINVNPVASINGKTPKFKALKPLSLSQPLSQYHRRNDTDFAMNDYSSEKLNLYLELDHSFESECDRRKDHGKFCNLFQTTLLGVQDRWSFHQKRIDLNQTCKFSTMKYLLNHF